jgi:hypothetical protein
MDVTSLQQIGPYRVQRFIDAGAFAWVFEVADPKFEGRRLALKMLMPEAAEGEEFRRFESEARLLAQIDHPAVVTIFDFGRDEATGNFYYVMTYVDGSTLKARLKQGSMTIEEALPIFSDLLDGLARLHDKGIVHRDIKPANVLLGRDGRARLADLGIARVQAERSQTRTGVAVGTALYMSPEQARGREVDPRSDLFSIGLTLYEALTGNVVYDYVESVDSSSGMDVLMYIGSLVHTQREFDVRFDGDSSVPEAVQHVILKSLRLSADERFANARDMRSALLGAAQGAPIVQPTQAAGVSSHWVMAAGGAIALALIVAGAYFFYFAPQQALSAAREEAISQLEASSALGEAAAGLASAVQDLSPPPESALVEELEDRLDRGDGYLEDGRSDLEAGSFAVAARNLERGQEQYESACQLLADQFLIMRANSAAEALRQKAIGLSDRGAPEVVAEGWKRLTTIVPRTEAPATAGTGCAGADLQLGRLMAAEEAAPLATSIEQEMVEAWPVLVDGAYEKAVTARMVATAIPTDARDYKVALKEAKRFLLQGSRHLRESRYQQARDSYRSAERGFGKAAAIAPAALAQEESKALLAELESEGGRDLGPLSQQIARGDAAYEAKQWDEAAAVFKEAGAQIKERRAANAWRRAAVEAQKIAAAAQSDAVSAGADRSAPTEFAQAEVSMTDAARALEAGDARTAELGFAAARDEYGAAQKRAIQALRDADMSRASVIQLGEKVLAGGECPALESEEARTQCSQAVASLAEGSAALEALDAPAALRNFYAARESYARTQSAQVLWETTRPRPPVLVRRVPQRAVVRVGSRQLHSFAVEASDPNGDLLSYTWTVDGAVQEETGPTMKRRLEQGVVIAVTVDDRRGGELVEQWRVEVIERKPQ